MKRKVPVKPFHTELKKGVQKDITIVKFVEGSEIRLRDGQLVSLAAEHHDLGEFRSVLAKFRISNLQRLINRPEKDLDDEKRKGQEVSGKELADFNLYYSIRIDLDNTDPEAMIDELNALDIIEMAYPKPMPQPFVAGTPYDQWPVTDDFSGSAFQYYLDNNSSGIHARWAWDTYPYNLFSHGEGVTLVDIDDGWTLDHEDLSLSYDNFLAGSNAAALEDRQHGTAVVGIIKGYPNAYGVSGIASDTNIRLLPFENGIKDANGEPENHIKTASDNTGAGDIILLTYGIYGPSSYRTCDPNCASCPPADSQFETIPTEYDLLDFDLIQTATTQGKIVIEAAGNGQMDLNNSIYRRKEDIGSLLEGPCFDRDFRDSGAILVGAGSAPGFSGPVPLYPMCWSNYGNRVDLQGWGEMVMTTGYGTWFDGDYVIPNGQPGGTINYENQYYSYVKGTSFATPIVAGAAAVIQSYYKNTLGWTYGLGPYTMRKLLTETGTPQAGVNHIGPLPNLQAALTQVLPSPVPDMKANNSNGPINVSSSTPVNITVALTTGYFEQTNADVWVLTYVTDLTTNWTGWFYLGPTAEWKYYDPVNPNVDPVVQSSLVSLSSTTILNSTLPPGYTYTFYFGVDLSMNTPKGLIDDPLYLDSVTITVPALITRQSKWIILPITPEKIGVFRNGSWYLDKNGNDAWDGSAIDSLFGYGLSTDKPITGDWNGDGIDTVGIFRDGTFYLRNSNSAGFAEIVFNFGNPGDIPLVGDWNGDGIDTIGVFRNGYFYLRNSNSTGFADIVFSYGIPGDIPVTGDWNGNGVDTIGIFRSGVFYLRNSNSSGFADVVIYFGLPGDMPVTGDWNGDGKTDIGVFRNGTWVLDLNGNRMWDGCGTGQPDACPVFIQFQSGDKPVVGRW